MVIIRLGLYLIEWNSTPRIPKAYNISTNLSITRPSLRPMSFLWSLAQQGGLPHFAADTSAWNPWSLFKRYILYGTNWESMQSMGNQLLDIISQ